MKRLVIVAVLVGCIQPQLQPCGDKLCSIDSVCLPSGDCATKESVDVCVGQPEGTACMTALFTGACIAGVCTSPTCGDGIVSGSEQCDGAVSDVDCVQYGFDTGIPSCSPLCAYDVVGSCVRFGWKRELTVSASAAWTNGTLFAVLSADAKTINIYKDGVVVQSVSSGAESFYSLVGNGTTVVANTYSRVVRSENGGPFTDVALTPGLPPEYTKLQLGDDGTIYVVGFFVGGTEILKSVGGGLQQILATTDNVQIKFTGGCLYAMSSDWTLKRYVNNAWSAPLAYLPATPIDVLDAGGGSLFVVVADRGVYGVAINNGFVQLSPDPYNRVVATASGVYFGSGDTQVLRIAGDTLEAFSAPIYGSLFSDGVDLYVAGAGIHRFTGTAWAMHQGVGQPATDIAFLGNGTLAITTITDIYLDKAPFSWTSNNVGTDVPTAIAGARPDDFYVATNSQLVRFQTGDYTSVTTPSALTGIADLWWDDPSATLYALGASGISMTLAGQTWTRLDDLGAGCSFAAIVKGSTGFYAVGSCGLEGVIWSLTGTTWTEVHRSSIPLVAMAVDNSDNLYATSLAGGVVRIGGVWHDEPRAKGVSISATSPNDIWVGGGPDDVLHWDGTNWSRVAIVGPASPHVLATPSTVYIAGARDPILLR